MNLDNQSGTDERAKFENYMTNDCLRDLQELSTNEHGEYDDADIDNAWSAWKAALQAQPSTPANPNAMPQSDYVLMPRTLTAENGAKAELSGEFKEEVEIRCPECDHDAPDLDCEMCEGKGHWMQIVPVEWSTIKNIYRKAVECCAATPADMPASDAANFDLLAVILWLEGGCDPKHAASELRLYHEKMLAAAPKECATVPVDYFDAGDGVGFVHPTYGSGVFFTEDCIKSASTTVMQPQAIDYRCSSGGISGVVASKLFVGNAGMGGASNPDAKDKP